MLNAVMQVFPLDWSGMVEKTLFLQKSFSVIVCFCHWINVSQCL